MIWWHKWVGYWLDMICGAIGVLSLGLIRPWWDFDFRAWSSKKALSRKLKFTNK